MKNMKSKQLYNQLEEKIKGIQNAIEDAQAFADEHGLILHLGRPLPFDGNPHYVPNVNYQDIKDLDNQAGALQQLIEYYAEESAEYDDEPKDEATIYNDDFRGKWLSSSSYCP
jgi:hypothetical protein